MTLGARTGNRLLGDGVGLIKQFAANSAIYTATNIVQKGAAFLLLPLYTLYLDPHAYGILAVVTSINGLLGTAFTLGLTGAITRFYFEYDDPELLAEFWGTVLVSVLIISALLTTVLLLIGNVVLRPLIGEIPFWPYVALGVLTTFFQPFFASFLAVLQTRNQAARYSLISLGHFTVLTAFTVAFVVLLGWGVTGALVASLASALVFFLVSFAMLRHDFRFCFKWHHLRHALGYTLPQVPHSLAGHVTAVTDKLVLNARLGASSAGVYAVGAMIAMIVEIAAHSVNRAYVPLSMAALKERSAHGLAQLRALGSLIVAGFCLLGVIVAAFSRELTFILAAPKFSDASVVIPILAFGGVLTAIYYLLVNVLFYERSAIKFLPLGTLTGAVASVVFALLLVPVFGSVGAAAATLIAQILALLLIGVIGRRYDPVRWPYGRYSIAFVLGLSCALWLGILEFESIASTWAVKLACIVALAMLLSALFWGQPLILARAAVSIARRRPAEAAALFVR